MSIFWRFIPARGLLRIHNFRWLILSRFFADLIFYSTTIVLFQGQRGLNFTQMFLMESILSAGIWTAELPTSVLADRFDYRRMIVLGRAINAAGMVVFLFAHDFWVFALSNILGGIAYASASGCESALAYNSLSADQRKTEGSAAFALLGAASSAGFFLGLFTGSFLGAASPTLAVAASIVPLILSLLAAQRLRADLPPETAQDRAAPLPAREIVSAALRAIRSRPLLILLSVFNSLSFALANSIYWYNQPFFLRAGIPVALFGPLMAAAAGLQFVLMLRIPALQRVLGTRLLLALSCVLPGAAYALLAWTQSPSASVLLVTAVVAFSGWRAPLVENELNRHIADASRATALSALSLTGSLGKAALDPGIGYLGDLGLLITGTGLGLGLAALGLVAPWLIPKQPERGGGEQ